MPPLGKWKTRSGGKTVLASNAEGLTERATSNRSRPAAFGLISTLKLVIHDFAGHPFPMELSRALAGRGHRVRHLLKCPSKRGNSITALR